MTQKTEKLLYGTVSVLFPLVIFSYLCARNINEITLSWVVLAVEAMIALLALLAYDVVLAIVKRPFCSFVFCNGCWLGFYLQPILTETVFQSMQGGQLMVEAVCFLLIATVMSWASSKCKYTKQIVLPITFILILMLAFNLPTIVSRSVESIRLYDGDFGTFYVDETTKTPNIFWIHADGMLSVEAVEKYFLDNQQIFLSELSERGFQINPKSKIEVARRTKIAIPALMSPNVYDDYEHDYLQLHSAEELISDGLFMSYMAQARRCTELQLALYKNGYEEQTIGNPGYYDSIEGGMYYNLQKNQDQVIIYSHDSRIWQDIGYSLDDLKQISAYLSYLVVIPYEKMVIKSGIVNIDNYKTAMTEKQLAEILVDYQTDDFLFIPKTVKALHEILHARYQTPLFVIIENGMAHYPFCYDETGKKVRIRTLEEPCMNPLDYYPQHVWSAKVLINIIDMILEVDPDAVIVIQADHGLHGNTEEEFKAAFGPDAVSTELWNSTMSALRVPEKYQTGEEHYAMENPLNISRYLVNSFVGRNYDYLPPN